MIHVEIKRHSMELMTPWRLAFFRMIWMQRDIPAHSQMLHVLHFKSLLRCMRHVTCSLHWVRTGCIRCQLSNVIEDSVVREQRCAKQRLTCQRGSWLTAANCFEVVLDCVAVVGVTVGCHDGIMHPRLYFRTQASQGERRKTE